MKILYLHINNYNQFQGADINLGGEHRLFYDKDSKTLTVKENEYYIPGFFKSHETGFKNEAYINNVTCIIGENGAGKSSVLNFIKNNIPRGMSSIQSPLIIAIKLYDGNKRIYFFEEELPIVNGNYNDFGFELVPLRKDKMKSVKSDKIELNMAPRIPDELREVDFIFVSNVFDATNESEVSGLYNISTNFLVKQDKKGLVENQINKAFANEVDTHRIEDVIRQVNLIFTFAPHSKYIKFDLPENLYFSPKQERDFVNDPNSAVFYNDSAVVENINLNFIEELISIARSNRQNDVVKSTVEAFMVNALINFLIEAHREQLQMPKQVNFDFTFSKTLAAFQFGQDLRADLYKIIDALINRASKMPSITGSIGENYKQIIANLRKYFKLLDKFITSDSIGFQMNGSAAVFFLNVKIKTKEIKQLINVYKSTFQLTPYLDFKWHNISSGQLALLNLYSRIFSKSDSQVIAENAKLKKSVVILIDEADTYLHPHWSQVVVQSLIDFTSTVYASSADAPNRQVQLIFTSNSPFIAADVPSSNVVFLKKELKPINPDSNEREWKVNTIDSLENKSETFGANIHTLLLDSFFLPFGTLSLFAKNKIEHIITMLNKPRAFTNTAEKEEIRKTIHIIGEPVIKRKLLEMFNDRYNLDIDGRIAFLESEIKSLRDKSGK